jgi:fido (protein-threonine AMPylation protein)
MTMLMPGRGRPSRAAILSAVDEGVEELTRIGGLPSPFENEAIWGDIWKEESHHSTAIEGNTLLLKQVQILLDSGVVTGPPKDLSEILEVQAYAEAARWVYEQALPEGEWQPDGRINLAEIREIHRLVVEPVWRHFPPDDLVPGEGSGSFRLHDIQPFAGGMQPPPFTDIPALIGDWLAETSAPLPSGAHVLEVVAGLHAQFEQVHPFRDGNGRTGRLVMNLLLVRCGYPPAIILKQDRDRYLAALRRADPVRRVGNLAMMMPEGNEPQRADVGPLTELLARAVKRSIDRFLLPGLAGPHRMLPLSALTVDGVSAVGLRRAAERGRLVAQQRNGRWYSTRGAVDTYLASRRQGRRRR